MHTATDTIQQAAAPQQVHRVLNVQHVYKAFGTNKVLADFSLEVQQGELVVVLGKSGSGKSVLIKCIIGLLAPDEGTIEVLDKSIPDLGPAALDQVRARIGFLFQSNALYDSMTVRENLEFPLRRHWIQASQSEMNAMVMDALEDVGLAHTVDMMPAELSGGMRKRIALARTLILKPEIILYDEPTTGLDPVTGREIIGLMQEIRAKYNTTSVVISHDMHCVQIAGARIVVLVNGCCYADGTLDELKKMTDPNVLQFFQ